MICPKCKKQNNKEVNIEFIANIKSFQRKRKCKCGHIFTTYEHVAPDNMIIDKLNFKYAASYIRKTEIRTVWQDWRFLEYAKRYYVKCFTEISKFLKKENLEQKFEDEIVIIESIKSNVRGKILYRFKDIKSKKVYEFQGKDLKMRSIRGLLKNEKYWENRKRYLNKPYPSDQDKKDEERQFIKSLSHKKTGIRAKKYNIEFLRQDWVLSKVIGKNQGLFWEFWKEIR